MPWTTKTPIPTERNGPATVALNGRVHAIGGQNWSGTYLTAHERYDPFLETWVSLAPLPSSRYYSAAVLLNGLIYVVGGRDPSSYRPEMWSYNPSTDSWTQRASMTNRNSTAPAAVLGGLIYVMGGWPDTTNKKVESYDPSTNSWTARADLPVGSEWASAASLGGYIYYLGGRSTGNPATHYNNMYRYDSTTNTWTEVAAVSGGYASLCGLAAHAGRLYKAGGYNDFVGASSTASATEYTPSTNSWAAISSMNAGRYSLGLAATDSGVYAIGGFNQPNPLQSTLSVNEEYLTSPIPIPIVGWSVGAA